MKPTPEEIEPIEDLVTSALRDLRAELTRDYTEPISDRADRALTNAEYFAAIALRVLRKTNPSRIREAARIVEIKARIVGKNAI